MKHCMSIHPKKGVQCKREAGHVGIHLDAGTDIGPAAFGNGRAYRYQSWEAEVPTPLALHDCITRHVKNDAFRRRRIAADKKAKKRVKVQEKSLKELGTTLSSETLMKLRAVQRKKNR